MREILKKYAKESIFEDKKYSFGIKKDFVELKDKKLKIIR